MKIFGRFTLNKNRVWSYFQNFLHRENISFCNVLQSCNKTQVCGKLFVPPAVVRGKQCAYIHLVYRCIQLDPRKPCSKCSSIRSKQSWKIGILKVANPVGHTKMTEVYNRNNFLFPQFPKGCIGKT